MATTSTTPSRIATRPTTARPCGCPTTGVLAAAADDPAMAAFGRHFPNLTTTPIESGHFLCEEAPEPTAAALIDFLDAS